MKTQHILTAFALAATAAACTEPVGVTEADRVVIEIEYINNAWEPTYFGFFIDGSGRVFEYDRQGQAFENQEFSEFTAAELDEKFANRVQVAMRSGTEVFSLIPLIDIAGDGDLSEIKAECADAGSLTYRAYRFDTIRNRYIPVLLRVEGDFAQENTSEAAQELIAYIRSLELMEELLGCDP